MDIEYVHEIEWVLLMFTREPAKVRPDETHTIHKKDKWIEVTKGLEEWIRNDTTYCKIVLLPIAR